MLYTNALKQLDMQDISIVLLLIENRSAKRVSEMLNLSQSSVSYSLKKLRSYFDDKLFESSDGVMQPTARVLAMKPYLQNIVQCINQCAKEGVAQTLPIRQWNITAPEYFEVLKTFVKHRRCFQHRGAAKKIWCMLGWTSWLAVEQCLPALTLITPEWTFYCRFRH